MKNVKSWTIAIVRILRYYFGSTVIWKVAEVLSAITIKLKNADAHQLLGEVIFNYKWHSTQWNLTFVFIAICGAVPSKGKRKTLSVWIECLVVFLFTRFIFYPSLYHVFMWEYLCSISSQDAWLSSCSRGLLEDYYSHHIVCVLVIIFVSLISTPCLSLINLQSSRLANKFILIT